MWAILTAPDKRGGRWRPADFFATGAEDVARLWPEVERRLAAWSLPPPRTALDYGCGAGRIAQALAARGLQVLGRDVSPRMVELARSHNRHPDHCRYEVVGSGGGPFDLLYSGLVLQHVPPTVAEHTLAALLPELAPRGLAVVQVVTGSAAAGRLRLRLWHSLPRGIWRLAYRLRGDPQLARVPVWPLTLRRARRAIDGAGCVLREVQPNGLAGPEWRSVWLWITRPAAGREGTAG